MRAPTGAPHPTPQIYIQQPLSALQSPKVYWGLDICTACSLKLCQSLRCSLEDDAGRNLFPKSAGLLRLHAKQSHLVVSQYW